MSRSLVDLRTFLDVLRREGELIEIDAPVDPDLEAAEVHRRCIAAGGPALECGAGRCIHTNVSDFDFMGYSVRTENWRCTASPKVALRLPFGSVLQAGFRGYPKEAAKGPKGPTNPLLSGSHESVRDPPLATTWRC